MTNFINQRKSVKSAFYYCLLLTAYFLSVSLPAFADTVGFFSKAEGRVDILKEGDTKAVPVNLNDNVSMGDIVRTKSDGTAELTFKDDTTVRIASETRLKIDEYTFNPDNSRNKGALGLFRGKVRAVVSKTKGIIPVAIGASTFNINTPTAIAGVKGTDFFVFYDRGITGVIFKEGQGFVVNPNMPEQVVNVNAGQITFIKIDAPPLPPRPASNIEMTQHTKDTAPAEKPKEKKEEEQKTKEEKKTITEAKAEDKGDKDQKKEDSSKEEKQGEDKSEVKEAKIEVEKPEGDGQAKAETGEIAPSTDSPVTGSGLEVASTDMPVIEKPVLDTAPSATVDMEEIDIMSASPTITTIDMEEIDVMATNPDTMIAGGEDVFGFTQPTDITVISETVTAITDVTNDSIGDIITLLPVTETQPQTLQNTDVTINVKF